MSKTDKPTKVTVKGQSAEAPAKELAKPDVRELNEGELENVAGGAVDSFRLTTSQVQQVVQGLSAFHIGAWGGQ
jgi:hypothetical protein